MNENDFWYKLWATIAFAISVPVACGISWNYYTGVVAMEHGYEQRVDRPQSMLSGGTHVIWVKKDPCPDIQPIPMKGSLPDAAPIQPSP